MAPLPLSARALPDLAGRVRLPGYGREALSPGIIHFGVGNFHRAHQGVYLDSLFGLGRDRDWALVGAGVRPEDARMREALAAQDWLTTVVEQEAGASRARVIGSMVDFIDPTDRAAVLMRLADPAIRIVSLTVTEGGYFLDPATGGFDTHHPDILADAARPENPQTVFGLIAAGLARRRANGTPPFTVMSCDNLPHNGYAARAAVTGLARLFDPGLADWIEAGTAFPNSMVDRITPATGAREKALLAERYGVADAAPVFCERFSQWVLEDDFPAGRPALEAVGVQFVPDVAPYETMKIRILNGGHATIAYPAGLLGIHFVHEAMADPQVAGFLAKVSREEIVPVVPPVPGTDLNAYRAEVEKRFANPAIGDTVRRLALDGSNRQPKFIIPSIADRLTRGAPVTGLALVSAFWCRYCAGTSEDGTEIAPNDPNWPALLERANRARHEPREWLAMEATYGALGAHPDFIAAFSRGLETIWTSGTRETLERYLSGTL